MDFVTLQFFHVHAATQAKVLFVVLNLLSQHFLCQNAIIVKKLIKNAKYRKKQKQKVR